MTLLLLSGCTLPMNKEQASKPLTSKPLIIAHRGAMDRAPEETLLAFDIARQDKADFLEMDLRQTKDGELVLMHDSTVNRTTNGSGKVYQLTLEQIKKLDSGIKFGKKFEGLKVATLKETVDYFGPSAKYYIETRTLNDNPDKLGMEEPLLDILNQRGLIEAKKVVIQSGSSASLKKIHELDESIPLMLGLDKDIQLSDEHLKEVSEYVTGVMLDSAMVNEDIVKRLQSNNLVIHVYFLNAKTEKTEQIRVLNAGVDGIITNHVPYTKKLLRAE